MSTDKWLSVKGVQTFVLLNDDDYDDDDDDDEHTGSIKVHEIKIKSLSIIDTTKSQISHNEK